MLEQYLHPFWKMLDASLFHVKIIFEHNKSYMQLPHIFNALQKRGILILIRLQKKICKVSNT